VVEDSSQELEEEVEKLDVTLVPKHDICLGIVLRTSQQTKEDLILQRLRKR
jgi:hypothetical protein